MLLLGPAELDEAARLYVRAKRGRLSQLDEQRLRWLISKEAPEALAAPYEEMLRYGTWMIGLALIFRQLGRNEQAADAAQA